MGRPSVLKPHIKTEILRRLAMGEKAPDLRKEFKLTETTFRRNFSEAATKVREVATALATAEAAFEELPVSAQVTARDLANRLKGISMSMAQASEIHASNAKKLARMAQTTLDGVDPQSVALGLESADEGIKRVMRLTTVSNEASRMPMGLMQANKEAAKEQTGRKTLEDLLEESRVRPA